jgi:hypothetical protein
MPVIMLQEIAADPSGLEQFAAANKDTVRAILEAAKKHGLIAHRFYGSEDGKKVLIVDEWPDRESFESFADEQARQIEPMFKAAWRVRRIRAEVLARADNVRRFRLGRLTRSPSARRTRKSACAIGLPRRGSAAERRAEVNLGDMPRGPASWCGGAAPAYSL